MKKSISLIAFGIAIVLVFFAACKEQNQVRPPRIITENNSSYLVQDSILIPTADGANIHAVIVRNSELEEPAPTILFHTIYARKNDLDRAKMAADHGYIGVVSYTRGKGLSPDSIVPYKYEAKDAYEKSDFVSFQTGKRMADELKLAKFMETSALKDPQVL